MENLKYFRNKDFVSQVIKEIHKEVDRDYVLMEVCGGHTMAIQHFGIPSLLPQGIHLLSGPGCPVCVTPKSYIDNALQMAVQPDSVILTYGDLLRVPGTHKTLEVLRTEGCRIEIVYSAYEALEIARSNPAKRIIFLAIGFETSAPGNAITLIEAKRQGLTNFFFYSAQKIMPPAMEAVVYGGSQVQGFICPGHVSTISGAAMYDFLAKQHGMACVISGFEPLDILLSILMLIRQINAGQPRVEIQYKRAVKMEGNARAKRILSEVYDIVDDEWRGFGIIPKSGLTPKMSYTNWDAAKAFNLPQEKAKDQRDPCICGEILRGRQTPDQCPLFRKVCSPVNPVGACMVSSEGACAVYYKYHSNGR